MTKPPSPQQMRALLERPGILRSLGAHDVFSAWIMEQAGLEFVFLGGFGASASMLGLPDLNFLTMTEMADAIRRTTARLSIPVLADGDTGHGDLPQVRRTVTMFEQAGAAGLLLEDQVMPKRCGHFREKKVVSRDDMLARIRAAAEARSNPEFIIVARTDARQIHGLEEAIERVNRCGEAGADLAFVEAPQSLAELEIIPRKVRYPVLANMLTGGVTPVVPVSDLDQMGYKIAVAPIETLLVTARAVRELCQAWQKDGRVDRLADQAMSFQDLQKLLGVESFLSPPSSKAPDPGENP